MNTAAPTENDPNTHRRIVWIDIAKAIAMILVFYGHISGSGDNPWFPDLENSIWVIYLFHMPLFFMLSGLTFNPNKAWREFIVSRFKRLIIPYFFFSLYGIAKSILKVTAPTIFASFHAGDMKQPSQELLNILLGNARGLWFFLALFWGDILLYAFNRICGSRLYFRMYLSILVVIALFGWFSIQLTKTNELLPLQLMRSTEAIGFVGLGWLLARPIRSMNRRTMSLWGLASIFAFILCVFWASKMDAPQYPAQMLYTILPHLAASITGSLVIITFAQWIPSWHWLLYIGRNTLTYYGLNGIAIAIVRKVLFSIIPVTIVVSHVLGQLILGISIVLIAILICRITTPVLIRWCWWGIGVDKKNRKDFCTLLRDSTKSSSSYQ